MGRSVRVPIEFIADLSKDLLSSGKFKIKIKGGVICYYKSSQTDPNDYVFVAAGLSPRQRKMLFG